MKRRTFVASVTASGMALVSGKAGLAQQDASTATPAGGEAMTQTDGQSGYAPVNGLDMYYEIHGAGETPPSGGGGLGGEVPLLVIHGAFGNTGLYGGELVPALAETRQVIVMDQQAHGRTADIDRPLSVVQMADDTAALIEHLGLEQVDVFGYSMGGGIAFRLAVRRPELVRKLVVAAVYTSGAGAHPEIVSGMTSLSPEAFVGSPPETSYLAMAPNPDDWPVLVEKIKVFGSNPEAYTLTPGELQGITAPVLYIIGDSDIVIPEHAVEVFRLLGGGVPGDLTGLPKSQLAMLPGTTHLGVILQTDLLLGMIVPFLDAPMPEAG
jgi:pimeloyl-ACP methyl ester carboxylesterase